MVVVTIVADHPDITLSLHGLRRINTAQMLQQRHKKNLGVAGASKSKGTALARSTHHTCSTCLSSSNVLLFDGCTQPIGNVGQPDKVVVTVHDDNQIYLALTIICYQIVLT